ncbi:uncharacterized protein LOC106663902 isoform X2 [Cimex lectularius]|uniref:Programmed cell death protein 7 n=1 Tax=Cimex lectularius TaxID=79782 RepID=A0A8I6SNW8_CIMLE|nr:uncharacterized protein LOC106663902 isoform X2 [Cimex lectularius]
MSHDNTQNCAPPPFSNCFPNFSIPPPNFVPYLTPPSACSQQNEKLISNTFGTNPTTDSHKFNFVAPTQIPPPSQYPNNFGFEKKPHNFCLLSDSDSPSKYDLSSWLTTVKFKQSKEEKPKLNVSTVKTLLTKYLKLVKVLERLLIYLKVGETSLADVDWLKKCEENELNEIAEMFDNPNFMASVELTARRARKKRAQRKAKRLLWQIRKNETAEFRAREHKRIDIWLEKMKYEVERVQREENVKREADLVLSDVNAKKSEAKRMLSLLTSLTKLRNARAQQKLANGKYVSEEETKSFSQIVEKLKTFWIEQLKEYNQEETGLRVMLNDAEVERKNIELAEFKKSMNQWSSVLFGKRSDKLPQFLQLNSLEEYITVRSAWDQFLSKDDVSSSIPVGWVVPVEPSSSEWAKYIFD